MMRQPNQSQPLFAPGIPVQSIVDIDQLAQAFANTTVRVVSASLDPAQRVTQLDIQALHAFSAAIQATECLQRLNKAELERRTALAPSPSPPPPPPPQQQPASAVIGPSGSIPPPGPSLRPSGDS